LAARARRRLSKAYRYGQSIRSGGLDAAALAELQYGHGLSKPSFFYVLIAAGLGAG